MTTIDTSSAVFKDTIMACNRSARQAREMDHPAFMAAMQACGCVYELINSYDLYHSLYPTSAKGS